MKTLTKKIRNNNLIKLGVDGNKGIVTKESFDGKFKQVSTFEDSQEALQTFFQLC